ncbi:MAG: VCBS repeat-containing protein, partial [Gemmatimonadetes bacterium]|nr:VCBS repeat-containing protein [Gemmatimonadota bacterium]
MTIRFSGCLRPIALVLLCVVPAVAETTFARALVLNEEEWESTGVPAIVDVDNDGYPDLVLTEEFPFGSRIEVVTIAEARYVSRRQTLLDTETSDLFVNGGAVVGDYDGDGDLDLFVPIFGDSNLTADVDARLGAGNLLLRNDGGHFSDATLDAGLSDSAATVDAAWFDYDVDGHLDLLVRNRGGAVPEEYTLDVPGEVSDSTAHDILYRNVGGGRFVDVTEAVSLVSRGGLFVQGFNEGLAAQDLNGDMIPDLLLGTAGTRNLLLINDNGIFRDPASGDVANGGLNAGIAVGDINNDGTMDIIEAQPTATISGVTNSRVPFSTRVLINIGGQFLDFTSAAGLLEPLEGISEGSPILADFDGDGDLDLVTQAVEISGSPAAVVVPPSLALFDNQGDGTFTSLQAGPLNERWLDNFCVGDFNRDGWLDIVTGPYPGQSGFAEEQTGEWLLYLNEGTENHWLAIELVGQESHRGGVGAQARVITADGAQIRQVTSSAGWSNTE